VANLFMQFQPLLGWRDVMPTERRTAVDFAEILRRPAEHLCPDAEKLVLVVDNLNTHTSACLYEAFDPARARRIAARLEWHYTAKHGSWPNVAGIAPRDRSRARWRRWGQPSGSRRPEPA
jgi:hypothetical protein